MSMKKFVSMVLVVCMVSSLLMACGKSGSEKETASDSGNNATTPAEKESLAQETVDGEREWDPIVTEAGTFPIVTEPITVTFAVPQNTNVEDYNTNYYTKWLEEKSGINIEFEVIPQADIAQKVQLAFASDSNLPDAYLGVGRVNANTFSTNNIIRYGSADQVVALNDYIVKYGENTKALFEEFSDGISIEQMMTSADGNIYYMPAFGPATVNRYTSKLWINEGWLKALDLEVPTTTEEFKAVLEAFATRDPNGNGKQDEIAYVGTTENPVYSAYDYLIGSFCVDNTTFHRLTAEDGATIEYAPVTDDWRNAMIYLNDLTTSGLLSSLTFTQDLASLKQIVNDENDICGAFQSLGVGLVATSQDVINRYIGIDVLTGPEGMAYAVSQPATPAAGGVITSACEHPEAVFRLFDLMLSFEASTISRYGIEGVNWETPPAGTKDYYGTEATLSVLENIWMLPQNTHWQNYCPFVNAIHNEHTAWNGDPKQGEYLNAQTAILYKDNEPKNPIATLIYNEEELEEINDIMNNLDDYTNEAIAKFAVGNLDPKDDAIWKQYLNEFEIIGLGDFLRISQTAYDRMTAE